MAILDGHTQPWRPLLAQCERRKPPSGPARAHAATAATATNLVGTTEPRCTLDWHVQVQPATACPAVGGPPTNLFCLAGVVGKVRPGVHDSFSSGFNVLYLLGADRAPIKGWK